MRIGALRSIVTIQTATETRDAIGGIVQSWTDIAHPRAAVEVVAMREFWRGYKISGEADFVVTIRYRSDFDRTARLLIGGKTCRIVSIINHDRKRRYLSIVAKQFEARS